jgi:hypothetical protein
VFGRNSLAELLLGAEFAFGIAASNLDLLKARGIGLLGLLVSTVSVVHVVRGTNLGMGARRPAGYRSKPTGEGPSRIGRDESRGVHDADRRFLPLGFPIGIAIIAGIILISNRFGFLPVLMVLVPMTFAVFIDSFLEDRTQWLPAPFSREMGGDFSVAIMFGVALPTLIASWVDAGSWFGSAAWLIFWVMTAWVAGAPAFAFLEERTWSKRLRLAKALLLSLGANALSLLAFHEIYWFGNAYASNESVQTGRMIGEITYQFAMLYCEPMAIRLNTEQR